MISPNKIEPALRALNAVLILARAMAYDGKAADVADALDTAEYLPLLMLESEDQTEAFRGHLVELAARFPEFGLAVERFDERSS